MEQKLKRATLALYAVGLIQVLTLAMSLYWQIEAFQYTDGFSQLGHSPFVMGPAILWGGMILFAIYKIAPQLRAQTPWAWAAALGIFVVSAGSYALPASVVGFISLLDRDVRTYFLDKLDVKI